MATRIGNTSGGSPGGPGRMGEGDGPQVGAHKVMIEKIAKDHGSDFQEAEQHILGFSHTVTGVANAPDFGSTLDELHAKGLLPGAEKYARMVIDNADIRNRLSG